jgi:hypothetical protein
MEKQSYLAQRPLRPIAALVFPLGLQKPDWYSKQNKIKKGGHLMPSFLVKALSLLFYKRFTEQLLG